MSDLPGFPPPGVAKPAQRALASKNINSYAELARYREAEIAALHGTGPKALATLKAALAEHGLHFRAG